MCLAIPGQIVAIDDEAKRLAVADLAGLRYAEARRSTSWPSPAPSFRSKPWIEEAC
jgi:hypothetical protein